MELYSFEDITCQLGRYSQYYIDCAQPVRMREGEIYKGFRNNNPFPIFTDTIFKPFNKGDTIPDKPTELLNFKYRTGIKDPFKPDKIAKINFPGRVIVLKRKSGTNNTDYFFIWVSQSLWDKYNNQTNGEFKTAVNVIFHPKGNLDKPDEKGRPLYPPYRGHPEIEEEIIALTDKKAQYFSYNYFNLGFRYLFAEKQSVFQHRMSLKKKHESNEDELSSNQDCIPIMIVVPVASRVEYFNDMNTPDKLSETIKAVSDFCFDIAQKENLRSVKIKNYPELGRLACSFYSFSGHIALDHLLSQVDKSRKFINEFFFYDVVLKNKNPAGSFDRLWERLQEWKAENPDRKIRIYSAYSSVSNITQSLERLGSQKRIGRFSLFNNDPKNPLNAASPYSGLIDGYEIYSPDYSVSVVYIPYQNFAIYLEEIKNAKGFQFDDKYLANDIGHSWFLRRLQSHSLYHSGFS